jgi:type IV pilus assembly protein PilO
MSLEAVNRIPKKQRFILIVILFVALIGLFFFYPFKSNHRKIEALTKQVGDLEHQIVVNKSLAEEKDKLLAKNAELQEKLLEIQQKFPTSSEVTDLLKQVSVLGQQSGLDIQLWKPRNKVKNASNLYYEIPVEIEVLGGYHDVGIFFDKVSKLSRIVNITDLSMSKKDKKSQGIVTKCVAKTFSALSEEEIKAAEQAAKSGAQGKKGKGRR